MIFLRMELSRGAAYAEMAHLLHKRFPNPTVVLAEGEHDVCISSALTRRSLAEQGATVVERVDGTGAFDPEDGAWAGLLDALAFDALPQDDLLAYLVGLGQAIRLSRAVPVLGRYLSCDPARADELLALIAEHDRLAMEVRGIEAKRRDKELSLNETARLRICDEVFGEANCVAQLIWKSRQNKDNRTKTGVSIDCGNVCIGLHGV